MIGIEIELDRRITGAGGECLPGDDELAIFPQAGFHLVTDHRSAEPAESADSSEDELEYSNLELVTDPFDPELRPDPVAPLLANLLAVTKALYAVDKATRLPAALKNCGVGHWLTAAGTTAKIDPRTTQYVNQIEYTIEDAGHDSLFLHYTVGIPVGELSQALAWIRSKAEPQNGLFYLTNTDRALKAGIAAGELFKRWLGHRGLPIVDADVVALEGYVALVFTHIAAILDNNDQALDGIIKNHAVAISRVPLRRVAAALPQAAQTFLAEQAWVDLLADEDPPAIDAFVTDRAKAAADLHTAKTAIGTAGIAEKDVQIAALTPLGTPQSQHQLAELGRDRAATTRWIGDAATACDEWTNLARYLPNYQTLAADRLTGAFPWSITDHAIVPALEGRALIPALDGTAPAAQLAHVTPDALFVPGQATDGGQSRDLATGLISDLGAHYDNLPQATVGEILRSALRSPGEAPVAPETIFGGMREVPFPDLIQVHGQDVRLIPLELRSHIAGRITWTQLQAALTELATFVQTLMPAPPAPAAQGNPQKRPSADDPRNLAKRQRT